MGPPRRRYCHPLPTHGSSITASSRLEVPHDPADVAAGTVGERLPDQPIRRGGPSIFGQLGELHSVTLAAPAVLFNRRGLAGRPVDRPTRSRRRDACQPHQAHSPGVDLDHSRGGRYRPAGDLSAGSGSGAGPTSRPRSHIATASCATTAGTSSPEGDHSARLVYDGPRTTSCACGFRRFHRRAASPRMRPRYRPAQPEEHSWTRTPPNRTTRCMA